MGALLEVGKGNCAPAGIARILASGDRSRAGPTAARGLFLVGFGY